jgi:hypothetical protein
MIERSYDPEILQAAFQELDNELDCQEWLDNYKNIMMIEGDNVGLATFEYEGFYTVHWVFKSARGRAAINLARTFLDYGFQNGIHTYRGLTRENYRAARYLARQVGFTSYGLIQYPDEAVPHELFILTKEEFYG